MSSLISKIFVKRRIFSSLFLLIIHEKFYYILLFFIFSILCSCNSFYNFKKINDIYIEKTPENQQNNLNKYDLDNKIYQIGRVFKYSIIYKSPKNAIDVKFIEYVIQGGTKPFSEIDSTYSQTVVKINYLNNKNEMISSERTGIIENELNTWLHPPRSNYFHILQINAFPFFIKSDSRLKKWSWELDCSHDKYININVNHKYSQKKIITNLLSEERYIIKSHSYSQAGKCKSRFKFSSLYGFTKMEFLNNDKSYIIFNLISIKEKDGTYYFKK